jgi:capsular polysaccharide biosynthesis protein
MNKPEQSLKIPSGVVSVASSKMFTYPTRLIDAWEPNIMEINLPAYELKPPDIEITVHQGSTQSLGIESHNIYKRLYKKFSAPIQMDEEYIYDSRFETDGNIAHILGCVAVKLLLAQKICPKITAILKENPTKMALTAYKILGFPVLCTDKDVQGKLVLTSDPSDKHYEQFYSSLFGQLSFEGYKSKTPERIFISRKGSRCLINENEIEQTLKEYGFEKFYFEDIPISEQWSVTRNAKVVVGMHGAALKSLVFNSNSVKVLELFHPGYVVDVYRQDTNAVGGTWCGVTGQLPDNIIKELDYKKKARSFALSSTKIDITSLRMALEYLEIEKREIQ